MAWIQEKTKEEVETLRDKLLQSGKIKSAGKVEKYIHHRDRKHMNRYIIISVNVNKLYLTKG